MSSDGLEGEVTQSTLEAADCADVSPTEIARKLRAQTQPEWADEDEYYEPREMYEEPMWHRMNGWKKWHAERDCGRETVYIIEDALADSMTSQRFAWQLYCARCGAVAWDEVLYLHRDWYSEQFHSDRLPWKMLKPFDNLWLHHERLLEVGGVPDDEQVRDLLRRSYYESEAQDRMAPPMPWERNSDE